MIDIEAEHKVMRRERRTLWGFVIFLGVYTVMELTVLVFSLSQRRWHAAMSDGAGLFSLAVATWMLTRGFRSWQIKRDALFDMERARDRAGIILLVPQIDAMCGCGAKLIRKDARHWVCPKEPWYTRWLGLRARHSALEVGLEAVPRNVPVEPGDTQKTTIN